jgi:hypothetical protein
VLRESLDARRVSLAQRRDRSTVSRLAARDEYRVGQLAVVEHTIS